MYINESTMTVVDEKSSISINKDVKKNIGIPAGDKSDSETFMVIDEDREVRKISIYKDMK